MNYDIVRLGENDIESFYAVLNCFGDVFDEFETYISKQPSKKYVADVLANEMFVCLAATIDNKVVGALAAYELKKFEQERSEIYIYDLAVYEAYRRRGIATALINFLKPIAEIRGSWVMYVQAHEDDEPAVKLYSKLGIREKFLNFDIPITSGSR